MISLFNKGQIVFNSETCITFHHMWKKRLLNHLSDFIGEGLQFFHEDIRHCYSECTVIDTPNAAWQQAQLSLSRGGLGLCSLAKNSSSAYISSLSASSICSTCKHLMHHSNNLANLSLLMMHYSWIILMLCRIRNPCLVKLRTMI